MTSTIVFKRVVSILFICILLSVSGVAAEEIMPGPDPGPVMI